MISQTDGAIGYTELAYAINSKLNTASMKNAKGEFVTPSVASITAAAASVKKFDGDLRMSIINVDAKGAYPISSFTYILLPEDKASVPLKEVRAFLGWALKEGQTYASELYYAPLPKKMSEAQLKTLK